RNFAFRDDLEAGGVAVGVDADALPFVTVSIEGDNGIAGAGAVDADEVAALFGREENFGGGGFRRRSEASKIGHVSSNHSPWGVANRKGAARTAAPNCYKLQTKQTNERKLTQHSFV